MTNLVAIILVSVVVFLLVGFRPTRARRKRQVMKAVFISIISVFILIVPLGIQTGTVARKDRIEDMLNSMIRKDFVDRAVLQNLSIKLEKGVYVVEIAAYIFFEGTGEKIEELHRHLEEAIGAPVSINLTIVRARRFKVGADTGLSETGEVEKDNNKSQISSIK